MNHFLRGFQIRAEFWFWFAREKVTNFNCFPSEKKIVHYFGILSKNDQYSSKARSVNSAFGFKKGHDMKNCPKKGSWRCFHVMTILRPVNLRKNRNFLGGLE